MKKILGLVLTLILCFTLVGCGNDTSTNNSKNNEKDNTNESSNNKNNSVTISSMKKAAKEAGYTVTDNYPSYWPGVVNGFTITYDNLTTQVVEYKDKETADDVAQNERDAGYNHPVQNGVFYVIVDIGYSEEITFFENLLNGRPIK